MSYFIIATVANDNADVTMTKEAVIPFAAVEPRPDKPDSSPLLTNSV